MTIMRDYSINNINIQEIIDALDIARKELQKSAANLQSAQKNNEKSLKHLKQCSITKKVSEPAFFVVEMEDGTILFKEY